MADEMSKTEKVNHYLREAVIFTIYGIVAYRLADSLADGAITYYFQNQWYLAKERYRQEMEVRRQTGKVIFEAMGVVENAP